MTPPRLRPAVFLPLLAAVLAPVLDASPSLAQQEEDGALLIRNATVVDGTGAEPRPGMEVEVRDGLIAAVRPSTTDPFDGRVLDARGGFLIPGLIDAHVHLSGREWEESREELEWLVQGGVTTVRDMAGDARQLAGLQQALLTGELTGPALYYSALLAGPPFMSDPRLEAATVGYAQGTSPYMIPVTPETDVAEALARARGTGATGVKLYAALDPETVRTVTAEAHRHGLQVWAHSAIFPARPVEILDAGVDGISHAPYVIWDAEPPTPDFTLRARGDFARIPADGEEMGRVIDALLRNGTVLDPTLFVFHRLAESDSTGLRLRWAADFTRRAQRAGVPIAAGTDGAGAPLAGELPNVHTEMALLVEWAGLTPSQALTAGTLGGALALGMADRLGTVEVGKVADLVLLAEDPTRDIQNTRTLVHVIRGGRVIR